MELEKKRGLIIRVLVVLVMILLVAISALGLFEHPIEVIILAIPLITFQILILGWQSIKWILISGIISVIVLITELLVNIFYFHHL